MKICIISPSYPDMKCGVGDYTARLAENIASSVEEVTIVTVDNPKVKSARTPDGIKNLQVFSLIKKWDFFSLNTLLKKMKSINPDVVHIQYHWRGYNDGFLLKGMMIVLLPFLLKITKMKCGIVLALHSFLGPIGGPYLFRGAGFLRRVALKPLLFYSDKIIINNEFDCRNLAGWFPRIKKKIVYIGGGTGLYRRNEVSLEQIHRIKAEYKFSDNEIVLSNFGHIFPYKGLEETLDALSLLRDKGYPVRLLSVGGFDIDDSFSKGYFDKLQKKAESLNVSHLIKWTGFCEPQVVSLLLGASDICVMPFKEGVSESRSSFVGALSHGLPVVTLASERTPKELINRVNIMFASSCDGASLAGAIEELINFKDLREKIAAKAKKLYDEEYSWEVITRKTKCAYNNGACQGGELK